MQYWCCLKLWYQVIYCDKLNFLLICSAICSAVCYGAILLLSCNALQDTTILSRLSSLLGCYVRELQAFSFHDLEWTSADSDWLKLMAADILRQMSGWQCAVLLSTGWLLNCSESEGVELIRLVDTLWSVNKRATLLWTITPMFLGGFSYLMYQWKQEWRLHRSYNIYNVYNKP